MSFYLFQAKCTSPLLPKKKGRRAANLKHTSQWKGDYNKLDWQTVRSGGSLRVSSPFLTGQNSFKGMRCWDRKWCQTLRTFYLRLHVPLEKCGKSKAARVQRKSRKKSIAIFSSWALSFHNLTHPWSRMRKSQRAKGESSSQKQCHFFVPPYDVILR